MAKVHPPHPLYQAACLADPLLLQNLLLRTPDVQLALILSDLPAEQAQWILARAGLAKGRRVEAELARLTRVRVRGQDLLMLQDAFLRRLGGEEEGKVQHYSRPGRKNPPRNS